MEVKVAIPTDLPRIGEYMRIKLKTAGMEDIQITMKSWNEPWRDESLTHYLATGWCFVANNTSAGDLAGFVLCQPLLFFQSWTQSLWVEYVAANDDAVAKELLDIVWRWAKSKHMQKVVFNPKFVDQKLLAEVFPKIELAEHVQLSATKMMD